MLTGKVIGSLVSTAKNEALIGLKLLVVQMIEGDISGEITIAADATKVAGVGDQVYLVNGKEAALAFGRGVIPIDAVIAGIIDEYNVNLYNVHKK